MKSNLSFFSDYVFMSSQCVFDLEYCFCPNCDYPHSQWDTSNRPLGMTTFTNFSTLEFTLNHHNNTFLLFLAMSLDIQINIQVPDTEGVLLECTSGSLIPPAEMTWRDSKGNIIPHSTTFDSQDRAGLLYLKSSILLKNRVQSPITCSIYNVTTNREKKRSIVLPGKLL